MTDQKFCKDCKHFNGPYWVGGEVAAGQCVHPKNLTEPDLVNARRSVMAKPADLRKPEAICGPDGVMFEAKPAEPPPEPKPEPGSWQAIETRKSNRLMRLLGR